MFLRCVVMKWIMRLERQRAHAPFIMLELAGSDAHGPLETSLVL